MEIRDAVESDFEEITAIYNEVLTHSTAIYNDNRRLCRKGWHGGERDSSRDFLCWSPPKAPWLRDLQRSEIFAPGLAIDSR